MSDKDPCSESVIMKALVDADDVGSAPVQSAPEPNDGQDPASIDLLVENLPKLKSVRIRRSHRKQKMILKVVSATIIGACSMTYIGNCCIRKGFQYLENRALNSAHAIYVDAEKVYTDSDLYDVRDKILAAIESIKDYDSPQAISQRMELENYLNSTLNPRIAAYENQAEIDRRKKVLAGLENRFSEFQSLLQSRQYDTLDEKVQAFKRSQIGFDLSEAGEVRSRISDWITQHYTPSRIAFKTEEIKNEPDYRKAYGSIQDLLRFCDTATFESAEHKEKVLARVRQLHKRGIEEETRLIGEYIEASEKIKELIAARNFREAYLLDQELHSKASGSYLMYSSEIAGSDLSDSNNLRNMKVRDILNTAKLRGSPNELSSLVLYDRESLRTNYQKVVAFERDMKKRFAHYDATLSRGKADEIMNVDRELEHITTELANSPEYAELVPQFRDYHLKVLSKLHEIAKSVKQQYTEQMNSLVRKSQENNLSQSELESIMNQLLTLKKEVQENPVLSERYLKVGSQMLVYARQKAEQKPNDAEAQSILGTMLRYLGDKNEAVEYFRRSIKVDPKYRIAHNHLGDVLWELGDLQGAKVAYENGIKNVPDDERLKQRLDELTQTMQK